MIVVITLVLAGLVAVAYFVFAPGEEQYLLSSYTYAEVVRGSIEETIELTGTLVVEYAENILSPQPGVVVAVYVDTGDDVSDGQLVAEISPKDLEDTLEERRQSLDRLRLDHERRLAERELEIERFASDRVELEERLAEKRAELTATERLAETGSASRQEVDQARKAVVQVEREIAEHERQVRSARLNHEYAVDVYELEVAKLEATIEELEQEIEECVIRSKISGKVMETFVSGGDLVSQYGKIARVADLSKPVAVIDVPENKTGRIYPDQRVTLTVSAERYAATIDTIAMEAQDSGEYESTVEVQVSFEEPPGRVVPGTTVAAEIVLGDVSDTLYLPRGQFLTTGNQLYLYRIEGDRAVRVEAVFGVTTSEKVEVMSGVREGDKVITSGYQDFLNYEEITLRPSGGRRLSTKE